MKTSAAYTAQQIFHWNLTMIVCRCMYTVSLETIVTTSRAVQKFEVPWGRRFLRRPDAALERVIRRISISLVPPGWYLRYF